MTGMQVLVRGQRHVIAHVHIAVKEHPLPGDEYIVEESQGVHLLKTRSQRMVEAGTLQVKRLPTLELQARCVAWQGKGKRSPARRSGGQSVGTCRVDGNLVSDGQRGQHPGAVNNYPFISLFDHRQGHIQ